MNIAIVGSGYVGLVTGACFAKLGHTVTCVDVDEKKIEQLNNCIVPIYEPHLDEIIKEHIGKNLFFTTKLSSCINDVDVVFSAVGTPPDEDGSADLKYVLAVAREFGRLIGKYTILVTKSTVPVGTAKKVKNAILEELEKRNLNIEFDVVSNPEFLKEGSAIDDFLIPDRVVIGCETKKSEEIMKELYRPLNLKDEQLICTDIPSAEMTKYAANSMLATRISFMNDIWNLCELVGADVKMVQKGIGADTRIGKKFLNPGCGYGGSCFPKDVKALIHTGKENGYKMRVLEAVEEVNAEQKQKLFRKVQEYFDNKLTGKTIGIWGLAFKPNTDDMREATSLELIRLFSRRECTIKVYDPIAMDECKRRLGDKVIYCNDKYTACENCDALCLVTEWDEFKQADFNKVKELMNNNSIIVDGRFIM